MDTNTRINEAVSIDLPSILADLPRIKERWEQWVPDKTACVEDHCDYDHTCDAHKVLSYFKLAMADLPRLIVALEQVLGEKDEIGKALHDLVQTQQEMKEEIYSDLEEGIIVQLQWAWKERDALKAEVTTLTEANFWLRGQIAVR